MSINSMIPLPSIEALNKVINEFTTDPARYVLSRFMPVVTEFAPEIRWDILGGTTGMTNAHHIDTEPRAIRFNVLKEKMMSTAYWKEVSILNESDILFIRRAGSLTERAAQTLITRRMEQLNVRLETRLEWLRAQALLGQLDINENGVVRSIDYEVPSAHKVTAGTPWSTVATADPIGDLQAWRLLFRGTGAGRPLMLCNQKVAGYLAQNAKVRELVRQSSEVVRIGTGTVGPLMTDLVGADGLSDVLVYDEGYTDANGVYHPFLPDNKVILIANGPAGEPFADFASTPTVHNGGVANATGGKFTLMKDEQMEANPSIMLGAGIYGLPRVYHPDWIIVATVA